MQRATIVGHTVILALTLGVVAAFAPGAVAGEGTGSDPDLWVERPPGANGLDGPDSPYSELAKTVGPAVVSILVSYGDELPPHAERSMPGPGQFAEGSGFVTHPDGYVVTNFHVVDRAETITVKFADGLELKARVVGGDPMTDIALLEVDNDDELPSVTLGDSSELDVGDYVVAIGNPLGLSHSMTAGIVSALDRRDLPIEGQEHQGNFIQIDAPINPGNSGGPLIDMNGDVIAINAAINRKGQGISFAIPINLVKTLLPQLEDRGYVVRSWLGVRIQGLDPMLARSFDVDDSRGALVTEVVSDSPASRAGIEPRDVIVGVNGAPIDDSDDLPLMISTFPIDSTITLDIVRDGDPTSIDVELESQPDQSAPDLPSRDDARTDRPDADDHYGISVISMNERLAAELDAASDEGVVVDELSEASPVKQAGLQQRDVILEVGSRSVNSEDEFQDALDANRDSDVIRLTIVRQGRSIYVAFPP